MFEKLELTRMAQGLAAYSGARLDIIARNMANADTPGYKAQDLPDFADIYRGDDLTLRASRGGHLTFGDEARLVPFELRGAAEPNGNTVSLEGEMVRAAQVRQTHDMALAIYSATSAIQRAALGRK